MVSRATQKRDPNLQAHRLTWSGRLFCAAAGEAAGALPPAGAPGGWGGLLGGKGIGKLPQRLHILPRNPLDDLLQP